MVYHSVRGEAQAEYTINKSRFIAHCTNALSEHAALEFLANVRKRHSQANHNCYAYRVRENNAARYSDDGEPGGTAGLPIMEVLRAKDVTDVIVVVTRYFGGVLLGAGGLVRAYTKAASGAVEAAGAAAFALSQGYSITAPYQHYDRLDALLKARNGVEAGPVAFAEQVSLEAYVVQDEAQTFENEIAEQFGGRIQLIKTGIAYKPIKNIFL